MALSTETEKDQTKVYTVAVTPGTETSEWKTKKSAGIWGTVLAVVGFGSAILDGVVGLPGATSLLGAGAVKIVGTIAGVLGVFHKTAVDKAYISSRTEVKKANAEAVANAYAPPTPNGTFQGKR